ncbi:hypothetical protein [Herbaspirillum sp. alder98]|uniref:hypothetical protein n=1 Tax=Herbaspirillum sp. alder98 TaxID=2913096 RepID=UPI001CD82847|nr:hypothetical protein [Herbaspirillum sp. alder98]MCA1325635.1 hypothetical protein [Herbaspirillum sp. alder98]
MGPIDNKPIPSPGYFHQAGDASKTSTALRSTFNPSPNNKITNMLARNHMPRAAGMVNAVRGLDLSIRQSWNQRRLDSARGKLEKMTGAADQTNVADLQSQRQRVEQREHNALRLHGKQALGEQASSGRLEQTVSDFDEALQDHLTKKDYVPLTGLSDIKAENVKSWYLNDIKDNHRLKVHSDGPPLLAEHVARRVSAAYDRGASGAASRSLSTLQHALVGIQGAALSVKGAVAGRLAESQYLDAGGRARMDVRAARSEQKRTMLQASLQGNASLRQAYRDVVEEQAKSARARTAPSDDPNQPHYVARAAGPNGEAPPQTRSFDRFVNRLAQPREVAPPAAKLESQSTGSSTTGSIDRPAAEPGVQRQPGRMSRFAMAAANLRNKRHLQKAGGDLALASVKLRGINSEEQDGAYKQQVRQSSAATDKAGHQYVARRSALQGKLLETLDKKEVRKMQDDAFPTQRWVHDELPWQPPRDDEQGS